MTIRAVIGIDEARQRGLKRYFTAEPCAYGHLEERHVSSKCCIECNRLRVRKRYFRNPTLVLLATAGYRKAKRNLIQEAKANPCLDCGGTFPPECMDLDHVRGKKLGNLAALVSKSREVIKAEIAKCEAVCANCHRIRTKKRIDQNREVAA